MAAAEFLFIFPYFFPPPLAKIPQFGTGAARTIPTSTGNGGFDQGIQLFVAADGQLQVTGSDPLDFEILRSVARQLQHLPRNREDTRDPEGHRDFVFFPVVFFFFKTNGGRARRGDPPRR